MDLTQVLLLILVAPFGAGLVAYKLLLSIKLANEKHQDALDLAISLACQLSFLYPFIGGIMGVFLIPFKSPMMLVFLASVSFAIGFCFVRINAADRAIKAREKRTVRVELEEETFDQLKQIQVKTGVWVGDQVKQIVETSLRWKYLETSSHAWKKQLYVKGRKLTAATVWTTMGANKLSVEQAADNWDLPQEAIGEIVAYCEANKTLLKKEAAEELRLMNESHCTFKPKEN
ncbi:MAG: hypothetical protein K2Y22_15200 [Candidatus Obscuribacterales bacterium]|nr:hypothetical protein [Candidatus Obscuribacterales bacterium]